MMKVFLVLLSCTAIQGLKIKDLADSVDAQNDNWIKELNKFGQESRRNIRPNSPQLKAWNFLSETQIMETIQEILQYEPVSNAITKCEGCEEPVHKLVHKLFASGDLDLDLKEVDAEPKLKDLMTALRVAVDQHPDAVQKYRTAFLELQQSTEDETMSEPVQFVAAEGNPLAGFQKGFEKGFVGYIKLFIVLFVLQNGLAWAEAGIAFAIANPAAAAQEVINLLPGMLAQFWVLLVIVIVVKLVDRDGSVPALQKLVK